MLMPMRAIFLLCGIFLIPDIFTASKSTENFFRPDQDYEEVQDYSENFKENVAEPLIIEEFETKQTASDPCQATSNIRRITLQTTISCSQGPYKELVKIPQSSNKFIWLTRCKGHVSDRTKCQATTNETILVIVDGQCFTMLNETKCEEKCITKKCESTQTFNEGQCKCESQKLF